MDERLLANFRIDEEVDQPGDVQPELHLVNLSAEQVVALFGRLNELGARWDDRTYHLLDEARDVTVRERPDVAELVVQGKAHAAVGAEGIAVDGVALPELSMFLLPDAIEFWWDAGPEWTQQRVAAFVALVGRLLDLAPQAKLRSDLHTSPEFVEAICESLALPPERRVVP